MTVLQAVILGVVQGVTEFLPISSSGHLILIPSLFGWEVQSLAFDTILHLGTAGALMTYFWRDLLQVLRDKKRLYLIIAGSVPAAILGFFLEDILENAFRTPFYVGVFLLLGSLIIFLAEKTYKKTWHEERMSDFSQLNYNKTIIIGVFQSLALFSGISRSGSTISGGMFMGLNREMAARFSFILSIPIVLGAGTFKVLKTYQAMSFDLVMLAGFLSSLVVGTLAIKFLLSFLKKNTLYPFLLYRVIIALLIFAAVF